MLDQFFSQISFVDIFNFCVFITFTICYTYQLYYVLVVLSRKPKQLVAKKNHRYAVVVSARNESTVICDLIHSIKVQNYPTELIDVFVIADNCTDNTPPMWHARRARLCSSASTPNRLAKVMRSITALRSSAASMPTEATRRISSSMPTTCST